jgi:hypothetical protein
MDAPDHEQATVSPERFCRRVEVLRLPEVRERPRVGIGVAKPLRADIRKGEINLRKQISPVDVQGSGRYTP